MTNTTKTKPARTTGTTPKKARQSRTAEQTEAKPTPKSVIVATYKAAWTKRQPDQLDLELTEALLSTGGLQEVADENGVAFKWAHLNVGMQRMNLGNVLRGKLRRGEAVKVSGISIAA